MKDSRKWKTSIQRPLRAFLVSLLFTCTLHATDMNQGTQGAINVHRAAEDNSWQYGSKPRFVKGEFFRKTTKEECEIRGGMYVAHAHPLPEDMVDCALPHHITLGPPATSKPGPIRPPKPSPPIDIRGEILGSSYDYLYRAGSEKPAYGLYSYALFPANSKRAERFLEQLFKTTSFVDLTAIKVTNLNLIYLPTRADKLSSLIPVISDGSAPPTASFMTQFYDYSLAQKLLAQICTSPAEAIRDVCKTDLALGPYLFTFRDPASTLSPVPPPYLFVDLSRVHERAFGEFIAAYKEQVKSTDYTDLERIDNLRLRLLTIVLTAADWIDPIKGAMAEILHIAK